MISNERRAFKRSDREYTVKCRRVSREEKANVSISRNISAGGVYFVSLKNFSVGELLDCTISMPDMKNEGRWTARVVRCDGLASALTPTFAVAVEFVEAFGDSEKNLRKTLETDFATARSAHLFRS